MVTVVVAVVVLGAVAATAAAAAVVVVVEGSSSSSSGTSSSSKSVSNWCFTPSQPVWLCQGDTYSVITQSSSSRSSMSRIGSSGDSYL